MAKKTKKSTKPEEKWKAMCGGKCGSGGCVYFLGLIGAAVYYISQATGFWNGVWGLLKALVWPAFLVHGLLRFLGM